MVFVTIQGHLTQAKLADALRKIVGDAWQQEELPVPGTRRRWDMAFTRDGSTTLVEYDGDEHYCNTLKIKADVEKDQKAAQMGYRVVRIPYWIQLTDVTLRHYFGLEAGVMQNFPHGFITTRISRHHFVASESRGLYVRWKRSLPTFVRL